MDNLFAFPWMFIGVREIGVEFIGTERERRGFPPKYINKISDKQFNTIHWINYKRNFQIQRWIDQNVVTMITKLHTLEDTNRRIRKKPRVDQANKNYLELVWGT